MKALPHRAWYCICDRAQVFQLRRRLRHQGPIRVNGYHRTMRYDDLEAVAALGKSPPEKECLCQIANELAERTMRGGMSAYWWLPLSGISYSGRGAEEIGEHASVDLFHLSAQTYGAHRHSAINDFTVNLEGLKEITQKLAFLFGLTIPA